jgi:hypothetical protein
VIEEALMSYRNDHDAALARIADLESELGRVRATTPPPAPPRTRRRSPILIAGAAALIGAAGAWVAMRTHAAAPPLALESRTAPPVRAPELPTLRACRQAIVPITGFDARTTDPHAVNPRAIAAIEASAARCRGELGQLAGSNDALRGWLAAEDAIAGDISRIAVYYGNDPYRLDNYATAGQLWRELTADVAARDAILPRVDLALGITHPES